MIWFSQPLQGKLFFILGINSICVYVDFKSSRKVVPSQTCHHNIYEKNSNEINLKTLTDFVAVCSGSV